MYFITSIAGFIKKKSKLFSVLLLITIWVLFALNYNNSDYSNYLYKYQNYQFLYLNVYFKYFASRFFYV